MYKLSILLMLLILGNPLLTAGQQIFQRTYGGAGDEMGRAVVEVASGGYAVAGTANSFTESSTDVYLLRLDESGNYLWGRHFGGTGIDWATDIVQSATGDFYICGYSNSFGNGDYDVLLMKVSSAGELIWQKTYGGDDWDFGQKLIEYNGFLYICGSANNTTTTGMLSKVNAEGELQWTQELNGSGSVEFTGISTSETGDIICTGTATANILNENKIIVAVFNPDGEMIRSFPVAEFDNATATDAVVTSDSTVAIAAVRTGNTEFGDQDQLLLKVNFFTGELLWSSNLGTSEFDSANALTVTSDDDLALAGSVYHYTTESSNVYGHIFRIGLDGSYLAGGALNILVGNTAGHSEFFDITRTADGGYICAGQSSAFGYNNQVFLLKVNAENEVDSTNVNYVDLATSIASASAKKGISIFPNPAQDFIQVVPLQNSLLQYSLISAGGSVTQSGDLKRGEYRIDIRGAAPGMYLLQLMSHSEVFNYHVIIQ